MKKFNFLSGLLVFFIFLYIHFIFASAESKIGVNVEVVDTGNVSVIAEQTAKPLEKITGLMSLSLENENRFILLILIIFIVILAAYIIIRAGKKEN